MPSTYCFQNSSWPSGALLEIGPLVQVTLEATLGIVSGQVIVDSGSQVTMIDEDALVFLGALGIRRVEGFGVGGVYHTGVFDATLRLQGNCKLAPVELELDCLNELRALDPSVTAWLNDLEGAPLIKGRSVRILGILGRDALQQLVFSYDGPNSEYSLIGE